jgi:para-nitrobenzyl esterase
VSDHPVITTTSGPVRGVRHGDRVEFLGIPFAADPVGELRFAPPREPTPWNSPLDAIRPGPAAPQLGSRLEPLNGKAPQLNSEQGCLTVNVWTPSTSDRAPVLFWVHGGAWTSGSGGWDWYSGARLAAEQNIVVVTFNYRLGALGYTYFADLLSGYGSGNFGLLDQIAALQWVVANIEAFGGDPDLITVGGQSAGAHSATLLAGAPATAKHVRRLLIQSGTLTTGLVQTPEHATNVARELLDVLEICVNDAAKLRTLEPSALTTAYAELAVRLRGIDGVIPPLCVVADANASLTNNIERLVRPDLDVMAGWTRDEFKGFYRLDPALASLSHADAITRLTDRFGSVAEKLYAHYEQQDAVSTPADVMAGIVGDQLAGIPVLDFAEQRANDGNPTYVYRFDYGPSRFGACHTVDLPFAFGTLDAWSGAPMLETSAAVDAARISNTLTASIGAFVRAGTPGPLGGHNPWPPYDCASRSVATINVDSVAREDLGQPERELLHQARAAVFR